MALASGMLIDYLNGFRLEMNLAKFVQNQFLKVRRRKAIRDLVGARSKPLLSDWSRSLDEPTEFYNDCVAFFYRELPEALREHRRYFTQARRGFGEDAFH